MLFWAYGFRMAGRSFRPSRHRKSSAEVDQIIAEAKTENRRRQQDYRARSLALHGWICARCAREFDAENLHLLTVHHKDGNHESNPPDGSNWENLCVYCHDAEHTKGLLGDYLTGKR
jgi:5-methylcytosine-specific restriction endonuclease McrA